MWISILNYNIETHFKLIKLWKRLLMKLKKMQRL